MAEQVAQAQPVNNQIHQNNDLKKFDKVNETPNVNPANITRERSFVRSSNHQQHNLNKRRSLAFNSTNAQQQMLHHHQQQHHQQQQQQQHMRVKPAMEIYRPPSNCNRKCSFLLHSLQCLFNRNATH